MIARVGPRPALIMVATLLCVTAASLSPPAVGAETFQQDGTEPADASPQQGSSGRAPGYVARWAPSYTAPPALPHFDGATSIAVASDGVWLATESFASHYADGVWSPPDVLPGAGAIFTVAAAADGFWAFGFEGGAWRHTARGWTTLPLVTGADLYGSTAYGGGAVAVGFDFGSEYGTVIQSDANGLTATVHDWMYRRQLLTIAATPSGDLWAGGCDYESHLFLMKKGPETEWAPVEAPAAAGCIHDISFAANGLGLAAAGGAVLAWNGSTWSVLAGAPGEDREWLRVAATTDTQDPGPSQSVVTGWALAGRQRWPSFVDPVLPEYFDGASWSTPLAIAPAGGTVEADEVEAGGSILAMGSDGRRAFSMARLGAGDAPLPEGSAALMALSPGRFELSHPLLTSAEDVASLDSGDVWVAGHGAVGVLHRGATWEAAGAGAPQTATRMDFAEADVGWSLGSATDPFSTTFDTASYWDGASWSLRPSFWDGSIKDLRALADGRAWGRALDGRQGQLMQRDPQQAWRDVPFAPRLDPPPESAPPGAPFDVVLSGGRLTGWVDGSDGLYRYEGGFFQKMPFRDSMRVLDLEMVNARFGWALVDDLVGGGGAPRRSRQLYRIADRDWQRVQADSLVFGVEWSQMAAADDDELWLLGVGRLRDGTLWQVLARFTAPTNEPLSGQWTVFGGNADANAGGASRLGCRATRIDAAQRRDGATTVWLGGTSAPCGPTIESSPPARDGFAGPVSVLVVAPVRGSAFLPFIQR